VGRHRLHLKRDELFPSEENARWLGGGQPGATIPVLKLSQLAYAWWTIGSHDGARFLRGGGGCGTGRDALDTL
jgi:hypothetical protein